MKKGIGLAALLLATVARAGFTVDERQQVARFWNEPGRYTTEVGRWEARLTPEGSKWLWNLNRARGIGKTAPTLTPVTGRAEWDEWINSKYEADKLVAEYEAARQNGTPALLPPPVFAEPAPDDLVAAVGPPPIFVAAVRPNRHNVRFDDAEYHYSDQVPVRQKYAYFRFPQGVMAAGKALKTLPPEELTSLLAEANVDDAKGRVMRAVSMLEGGFESINTYDTGFVSVGFIQFATLAEGGGSLGAVLRRLKQENPDAFQNDFRRYGIDVSDMGLLQVAGDQADSEGPEANQRIIDDKRLIAVFQRAGEKCRAFRIAQIEVAMDRYFPGNDPVTLACSQCTLSGKVGDFIKSEAGLATLMDRKVNTGTIAALSAAAQKVAERIGADSLNDLIPYEREIIGMVKYRKDYLADASLAQPPGTNASGTLDSRGGKGRGGRGGGKKSH